MYARTLKHYIQFGRHVPGGLLEDPEPSNFFPSACQGREFKTPAPFEFSQKMAYVQIQPYKIFRKTCSNR